MSDDEDLDLPVLRFGKGFSRNWNDIDLRRKDDNDEFCKSQSALSDNLHEHNGEQLVEEDEIQQVPSFYSQNREIICEEPEENEIFDEEKTWKQSLLKKRLSRDNNEDYLNDSKYEEEKQAPVKETKDPSSPKIDVISLDSSDTKQQFTSSFGIDTLKEKIGNIYFNILSLLI